MTSRELYILRAQQQKTPSNPEFLWL